MSTDGTIQPDPTTPPATGATPVGAPQGTPLQAPPVPEGFTPVGDQQVPREEEKAPGFISRHTTTLITLMVAVIVAAAAIAGVSIYRHNQDQKNSATEAAFSQVVAQQGASLETIQCSGHTCAAIVSGQAYTVLVQKDAQGAQHFGVSPYAGR